MKFKEILIGASLNQQAKDEFNDTCHNAEYKNFFNENDEHVLMTKKSKLTSKDIIKKFLGFAKQQLELEKLPHIKLYKDSKYSVKLNSFGGYYNGAINLTIGNRHVMDVCRTLAHELVHYKQDLEGRIKDNSGMDGSEEENEANAQAAVIMRKWGKSHPSLFAQTAIE